MKVKSGRSNRNGSTCRSAFPAGPGLGTSTLNGVRLFQTVSLPTNHGGLGLPPAGKRRHQSAVAVGPEYVNMLAEIFPLRLRSWNTPLPTATPRMAATLPPHMAPRERPAADAATAINGLLPPKKGK